MGFLLPPCSAQDQTQVVAFAARHLYSVVAHHFSGPYGVCSGVWCVYVCVYDVCMRAMYLPGALRLEEGVRSFGIGVNSCEPP